VAAAKELKETCGVVEHGAPRIESVQEHKPPKKELPKREAVQE
jgi:hypothetical protein